MFICAIKFDVFDYRLMSLLARKWDRVGWYEYTSLEELESYNRYDFEHLKHFGLVEEKPDHEPTDLFRLTFAGYMIFSNLVPTDDSWF